MSNFPLSLKKIKGPGWTQDDNLHEILRRLGGFIEPPAVVQKIVPGDIPQHLPTFANDGSRIDIGQSSLTAVSKINHLGTPVWTVDVTDINASADMWGPLWWYDNVDVALWVMAVDTATTPNTYTLARLADSDGGITVIGGQQCDALADYDRYLNKAFCERAAHGAGDFRIRYDTYNCTISAGNGSILAGPTQQTQNNIPIGITGFPGHYETADGSIVVLAGATWDPTAHMSIMRIMRGGNTAIVEREKTLSMIGSGGAVAFILWDDCVALVCTPGYPTATLIGKKFFARTDFDRWLSDLADAFGLPAGA